MFIKSLEIMNRLVGKDNWRTIEGLKYDTIILKDDVPMPSEEEFNKVKEQVELEYQNNWVYKEKRSKEYPKIEDQLDMLYWDKINGTDNWLNSINEIKQKYPK